MDGRRLFIYATRIMTDGEWNCALEMMIYCDSEWMDLAVRLNVRFVPAWWKGEKADVA